MRENLERERERLIIWALFDDGVSSYKNAVEKNFNDKFEIHSIGINDKKAQNYYRIDLSLINFDLFKELEKLPKPDIIIASPPCESWSIADANARMFTNLDNHGNWKVRNKISYDMHNSKCPPTMVRYFHSKEQSRILGEATIGATIRIIEIFKPKIWIIENPQSSMSWKYQENHWNFFGYMNVAHYMNYDKNFSLKPTIFKSNYEFALKHKREKGPQINDLKTNYDERSAIPESLVCDILEQALTIIAKNKPENENFKISQFKLFEV